MRSKLSPPTIAVSCLALICAVVQGQTLAVDWHEVKPPAGESRRLFEATGLPPGEFANVQLSPRESYSDTTLQQWLTATAAADVSPNGPWIGTAQVNQQPNGVVTATRQFSLNDGRQGLAVYFAVGRAAGQARLLRVTLSSEKVARGPQGSAAQTLVGELMQAELNGTLPGSASTPTLAESPPPAGPTVKPAAVPPVAPSAVALAPAAGLRPEQIETVFYHWDQRYDAFQGLVMDEAAYLLLKDGTAYDGFDIPPQDFDIATSRRTDPRNWGRWRREGNSYAFTWPRSPTTYRVPRGNPVPPSPPGQRLDGRFIGTASYTLPGGGTSTWSEFSATFTADGRFERSVMGGASSSVGDTHSNTTYDDDEVVSSSTSNSTVIAGRSRRGSPDDRRGSYQIDGYSIVLRYDSGRIERKAFFIDDKGAGVWLNGTRLMREKPKRKD